MLQKSVQVNRKILATPTVQCKVYSVHFIIIYIIITKCACVCLSVCADFIWKRLMVMT